MNPLVWVVVATAALSCFFSLAGSALRGFRRVQLEEAFAGANRQQRLDLLARHLQPLQLTVSFTRVLSNLVLVVAMLSLFGSYGSFAGTLGAILTAGAILAVFGVAIPQAWAAHAGERVLAATLGVLLVVRYALAPVTAVMAWFDLPIRRLSGVVEEEDENGDAAKQEILQAASEGQAEGAVDADELHMIESVMEFSETQAGEIMTPRTDIFALPIDTPFTAAVEKIVSAGHTRVPVYDGDLDNIIGVLYAKDLLKQDPASATVRSMLRKAYFVPETKPLDDLLKQFKARKVHLAIVLDEYGGTAGLVTVEDVVEEILGDIADEYDRTASAPMQRIDERTVEVDGRFYIDELNDALDLELPEDEDYDTVAGFVFSELGYIPTVGEEFESHDARFTVLAADERKITRLKVELLEEHPQAEP